MRVNRDEVANVRRVNVNLGESEVVQLVRDRVAVELGLDSAVAAEYLNVEFNDNHSAYVRGEVPLTREQQLEALGLTPSEPVETDGAAIAEGLPEQLETLDCVDERGRPAGPQSADVKPEAGTVVALRIALMARDSRIREIRAVVDSYGKKNWATAKDIVRNLCDSVLRDEAFAPLSAVERYHIKLVGKLQNDGELTEADLYAARDSAVQEYAAEVGRTTPVEGQALQHDVDAEDRRQLEVKIARIRELEQANADAGTWGAAVAARAEELRDLYAQVYTLSRRLETSDSATFREELSARQAADEVEVFRRNTAEALDKITLKLDTSSIGEAATRASEALDSLQRLRDAPPLVPRQETQVQPVVSQDSIYQARRRLTEMLEDAGSQGGISGHTWHKTEDLRYVVALLGGEAGTSLSSPDATWAELVETKPESRSAAAQERRRTLLKLADRLLQEVLLTDKTMSADTRCVINDVEVELRRMSR